MFNAWRTAATSVAVAAFLPGERGVITLAIKKDEAPSWMEGRMCDRSRTRVYACFFLACFMLPLPILATGWLLHLGLFCTREDDGGHHVLIDDVYRRSGRSGYPPVFSTSKNKTNEKTMTASAIFQPFLSAVTVQ